MLLFFPIYLLKTLELGKKFSTLAHIQSSNSKTTHSTALVNRRDSLGEKRIVILSIYINIPIFPWENWTSTRTCLLTPKCHFCDTIHNQPVELCYSSYRLDFGVTKFEQIQIIFHPIQYHVLQDRWKQKIGNLEFLLAAHSLKIKKQSSRRGICQSYFFIASLSVVRSWILCTLANRTPTECLEDPTYKSRFHMDSDLPSS